MSDGFLQSPFNLEDILLSNPVTAPIGVASKVFSGLSGGSQGRPQENAQEKALRLAQQRKRGQEAVLGGKNVYWDDTTKEWRELKPFYERYGTPPGVSLAEIEAVLPPKSGAAGAATGTDDEIDTGEPPQKPSLPSTTGPKEGTEPIVGQSTGFAKEILEQYVPYEILRNKLLARQSILNAAIAQQGREQLTRRQLETENIRAWRDLEQTRLQTQAQQAAAIASVAYLAQQPNVSTMQAFNEAFKSASAPLPSLKG